MDDEAPQSTVDTPSAQSGAIPNRYKGLRPPWQPGQSGNPSGLTRDGLPTKNNRVRQTMQEKLANPTNLRRFVNAWYESACNGDSAAREQILKRIDPILDDPTQGRTILEGLRLELTPGGGASVTQLRASSSVESFAETGSSESQMGGHGAGHDAGNPVLQDPSGVPPSTPTPVFEQPEGVEEKGRS